jgi:hypothetical protein
MLSTAALGWAGMEDADSGGGGNGLAMSGAGAMTAFGGAGGSLKSSCAE